MNDSRTAGHLHIFPYRERCRHFGKELLEVLPLVISHVVANVGDACVDALLPLSMNVAEEFKREKERRVQEKRLQGEGERQHMGARLTSR